MAERFTVDEDVAGSSPVSHPICSKEVVPYLEQPLFDYVTGVPLDDRQ